MQDLLLQVWKKIISEGHTPLFALRIGSHLFGTETDSSDRDYRIVYAPNVRFLANAKVPRLPSFSASTGKNEGRNTSEDIDVSVVSIQSLVRGFEEGEVNAIDTVFAPTNPNSVVLSRAGWSLGLLPFAVIDRSLTIKEFKYVTAYSLNQINRYGIRGTKIYEAKELLNFLKGQDPEARIVAVVPIAPLGRYVSRVKVDTPKGDLDGLRVFGKTIHPLDRVSAAIERLEGWLDRYGKRANNAAKEGIDWKAVSHAVRALYQAKEYAETGRVTFPRPEADHLKRIKLGQIPLEEVTDEINTLLEDVERIKLSESEPFDIWERVYVQGGLVGGDRW